MPRIRFQWKKRDCFEGKGRRMKVFLAGLFLLVGCSVFAGDFFGISLSSSPEEDFRTIFDSLAAGDLSSAKSSIRHLEMIRPQLSGKIRISDFKIPILASSHPPTSLEAQTCLDPEALRYMKRTFFSAFKTGHSFESAWATMQKTRNEHLELAPSRRAFKGKILLKEMDGVLLREARGGLLFLSSKSLDTLQEKESLEGYCWEIPGLSYSYEIEPEKFKTIALYTDSLWWDY